MCAVEIKEKLKLLGEMPMKIRYISPLQDTPDYL